MVHLKSIDFSASLLGIKRCIIGLSHLCFSHLLSKVKMSSLPSSLVAAQNKCLWRLHGKHVLQFNEKQSQSLHSINSYHLVQLSVLEHRVKYIDGSQVQWEVSGGTFISTQELASYTRGPLQSVFTGGHWTDTGK